MAGRYAESLRMPSCSTPGRCPVNLKIGPQIQIQTPPVLPPPNRGLVPNPPPQPPLVPPGYKGGDFVPYMHNNTEHPPHLQVPKIK